MVTDNIDNLEYDSNNQDSSSIVKNIIIGSLGLSLGVLGFYSYNLNQNLEDLKTNYKNSKSDLNFKIDNLKTELISSKNELRIVKTNYSNSTEQILKDEKDILDLTNKIEDLETSTIKLKKDSLNSKNLNSKLSILEKNYSDLETNYSSSIDEISKYKTLYLEQEGKIQEIRDLNKELSNKYQVKFHKFIDRLSDLKSNYDSTLIKVNDLTTKLDLCKSDLKKTKKESIFSNYLTSVQKDSNVWDTSKLAIGFCLNRDLNTSRLENNYSSKDSIKIFNFLKNNDLYKKDLVQPGFPIKVNCKNF